MSNQTSNNSFGVPSIYRCIGHDTDTDIMSISGKYTRSAREILRNFENQKLYKTSQIRIQEQSHHAVRSMQTLQNKREYYRSI